MELFAHIFCLLSLFYIGFCRRMTVLEAQQVLNDKVLEAFALAEGLETSEVAKALEDAEVQKSISAAADQFTSAAPNDSNKTAREKAFDEEQMKRVLNALKPVMQGYICVQLDINLDGLLPGLQLDLGLMGGVRKNLETNCWGFIVEALSIGFQWGFKVYGYGMGLGASVTGTLELNEVPGGVVQQHLKGDGRQSDLIIKKMMSFAPDGSDPDVCHSSSLWTLLKTFIEHEYRKIFSMKGVQEDLAKIQESPEYRARQDDFLQKYGDILNHPDAAIVKRTRPPFLRSFRPDVRVDTEHTKSKLGRQKSDSGVVMQSSSKRKSAAEYLAGNWRANAVDDNFDLESLAKAKPEDWHYLNMMGLMDHLRVWRAPQANPATADQALLNTAVTPTAVAMLRAVNSFVLALPSYADHLLTRLIDNSGVMGLDSELHVGSLGTDDWNRLKSSDGRYLARWPSTASFDRVKVEGQSKPVGVYTKSDVDDRVLNFAKVMRVSENVGTTAMWKELAMSAGNLLVRAVGDVKTLFSSALANEATWDGFCESLKPSFFVPEELEDSVLAEHTWASESADPTNRIAFVRKKMDSDGRPHVRLLKGVPRWAFNDANGEAVEAPELHPHVWCVLAENHVYIDPVEISVAQACATVVHREAELKEGDIIRKMEKNYRVYRDNKWKGILWGEVKGSHGEILDKMFGQFQKDPKANLAVAMKRGFKIAKRTMEDRPDCERVALPSSFAALFPSFMRLAISLVARMEEVLLHINLCLGETHNTAKLLSLLPNNRSWRLETHPCFTFEEKRAYVAEKARDAVRVLRWFLYELGAGDPRKCKTCNYKLDTVPLADYEERALRTNEEHFAPVANHMALDFTSALGVGPTDKIFQKNPALSYWRDHPDLTGKGIAGKVDFFLLEGFMWQNFKAEVKAKLFDIAQPWKRIARECEANLIRPPIEYTTGWVFTAQLYGNGFCTPNTAAIVVARVSSTTRQTWSHVETHEICWTGRLRPGSVFIQIARCTGSVDGDTEDPHGFVDWRIRLQSTLVGGDILNPHESGIIGNALTTTTGAAEAIITSGAALASGLLGSTLLDKLAPRLRSSSIANTLLMAAASSGPAMGTLTSAAIVGGSAGFEGVCKTFLKHLSQHGIVDDVDSGDSFGFSLVSSLIVWGVIVHRVKEVTLVHGPVLVGNAPTKITKSQRFISMHFENWNMASLTMHVPFAAKLQILGRVELDWDLTPWYENKRNAQLNTENEKRIAMCSQCLKEKKAFCDWRIPLTVAWTPKLDKCVANTALEKLFCEKPTGATDEAGKSISAIWHHPGNASTCKSLITYVPANKEFKVSKNMAKFFRRH